MSFQDVGRPGSKERGRAAGKGREGTSTAATTQIKTNTGALNTTLTSNDVYISPKDSSDSATTAPSVTDDSSKRMFAAVSDTILQYQRNVGILNNIAKSMGSKPDDDLLQRQYTAQIDVITQLGSKIEAQLRAAEIEMSSITSRAEATRARNTHIKLTRDFRTVEQTYKNIVLQLKQRKHFTDYHRQLRIQQEQQSVEEEITQQEMVLQLQREEENINLQIMREREEEIRKINQGVHTVNEIYKVREYGHTYVFTSGRALCFSLSAKFDIIDTVSRS